MANNFFNDSNKAYSENLNDGILVGNAFDWTVEVSLPSDTDGVFPNSSTIVKAKVADVSITPNSNLSIGSTISNSSGSSQTYRLTVYPNFNRFGGFKSITLTADSGVTFYIANKGGTSPIANNLDYTDLSDVPELKVLKEYDIVLTIANGKSVSGLEFVFQSSDADVSAVIDQDNVNGLDDRLTAIETFDSNVCDLVYPVGSIYMSVNSTSPATLFGGTWTQLKDTFLLACGDTYSSDGDVATAQHGSADAVVVEHTHTQNEHYHNAYGSDYFVTNSQSSSANYRVGSASSGKWVDAFDNSGTFGHHRTTNSATATNQNAGESGVGKNMPPYLAVYMWKRTA